MIDDQNRPMNDLSTMTTHEAAAAVERDTVVLLPVGAFEQHGSALPLSTDLIRAEAVTARVAERLPDSVVIGPAVPVGVSPHHLAFTGTVSLRTSTFITVVREYVESLASHGWRRFCVVTGHGGNNAALGTLAQDLMRDRPDLQFAWTPVTTVASDALADLETTEVSGHSGEAETSQMLHIAPHLVRTDLLEPGTTDLDQLDPYARLARTTTRPSISLRFDQLTPTGVLGDPRHATADDGRRIVDEVTDRLVDFIKQWCDT